ncbi:hypothetical protein LNP07_03245 [Apilactobacillus sp. M161]|uniref:Uncharacterized protein n=1 Tax=Apilactobacillus xinyiensis TaxID=2841032 RepID=A0ABT0I1D3_9LACO|nr:hypothetical protein [Apilactobacillus xinyiensis]MCK8624524.1 hypothetical protein [Apilactobacillus xinyiensis]
MIKKIIKHVHFWHNFMKNGKYKKYEYQYRNFNYQQINKPNHAYLYNYEQKSNESDYQLGYEQASYDIKNGNKIRHYPYKLMRFINLYMLFNKIREVVDYMHGYNNFLYKKQG